MVDIPVNEVIPTVQENPLVDKIVTMFPKKTSHSLKQQPQQSKSKINIKKHKKPEEKVDVDVVLKRLIKLKKKVDAMSKVDHTETINKSFQAHFKKVLPKDVPDFGKVKQEKTAKKNMPRRHDDQDPPTDADKDTRKRRKDSDSSSSKKDAVVDTKKMIQDDALNAEEQTHDDAASNQDRTKWLNLFNELVDAEKDLKDFDNFIGSTIDFTKFAKNHLKKDKITKADLEGPAFALLKGGFRNSIKLEYNLNNVT
ncbi:hypothetical protein Tco_0228824 [Tanacetum coccineum]